MAATTIDTVVAKGTQGQGGVVATATRLAASPGNDIWMRVMILAPSASTSMNATVLGDTDMTVMRAHFVKPQATIAMGFSDDPQMGMVYRPLHRIGHCCAGDTILRAADRLVALRRSQHATASTNFCVVLANARTHNPKPHD